MKRSAKLFLGGVLGGLLFCSGASAQTNEFEVESPAYSEVQIREALATCMVRAEMIAETNQQPFMELFSYNTQTFAEQLGDCVVWVLEGKLVEMIPLS